MRVACEELHERAVTEWHSTRPGADKRFIAIIDEIEARLSPADFERYRVAFPAPPSTPVQPDLFADARRR